MFEEKLLVSDMYTTVKSSGSDLGVPVFCLRLHGTNFKDVNEAYPKTQLSGQKVVMSLDEVLKGISALKAQKLNWLITGGEALLQEKALLKLIEKYQDLYGRKPYIFLETNGLIQPIPRMDEVMDEYLVNLKLSNSMSGAKNATYGSRIKEGVVRAFVDSPKAQFVFDIGNSGDITEVLELVRLFNIPKERVYLRPKTLNRELHASYIAELWEAVKTQEFKLTPRLDLLVFKKVL